MLKSRSLACWSFCAVNELLMGLFWAAADVRMLLCLRGLCPIALILRLAVFGLGIWMPATVEGQAPGMEETC